MTHAAKCLLRNLCAIANTAACSPICGSYVAIHGYSGKGGRLYTANVPADYRLLTTRTSPARTDQAKVYALIDSYVPTFTRQFDKEPTERIKSLYLVSTEPGTGKTTTACAVLNEWIITNYIGSLQRGIAPADRPAYFLDVNAWQTDYNTFNRPRVPEEVAAPAADRYYRALSAAQTAPFAVLDDIGVRDATEAFRSDLHTVINARVTEGLPTIYTSNFGISELERIFDKRLADRVRDMCVEISFEGESKRGMRNVVRA